VSELREAKVKAGSGINIGDEIKSRCNIVDVVGRVVALKKAGSNYKGVCPFHNEKTPSFVVSETKQIFTCFGCGATGDVIAFVERYYGLDFKGAAEMLAKEYGINLDGAFRGSKNKAELYEINRQAATYFFRALRERANPGYTYMKNRGISEEILNKFGIGYADDRWDSLYSFLKEKGIQEDKMMELGLISRSGERYYDKFRGRVMFPIMNTSGKVIGFGGRMIGDGEPKYLNSQESDVFQKKNNLYGLNLASDTVRKEDAIILVEGYMDVISLYQGGIRNVSASLGTALTENQARLIKRYTDNVILSYDADEAGQSAAFRGLDVLYKEGCRARVLKVTDGKDPDEFIKKNGRGAFLELLDKAEPYGDFKINRVKSRYDLDDDQQRIDFLRGAVKILRSMKAVEADVYIKKLAAETGVSEGAIRFEYSGNNSQEKGFTRAEAVLGSRGGDDTDGTDIPPVEQELLKLMLLDARFTAIPDDTEGELFHSSMGRVIYEAITAIDDGKRPIDEYRLQELLDEKSYGYLGLIEKNVITPGREDEIFKEDIATVRRQNLKDKEEKIRIRISMADEDENQEEIVDLMKQLMDIQMQIRK